ncbi:MAG: polysaccharide biosynthesis/export family protein [Phycisphaerae bacterium]|jgi:polysaccharide export outer membrane protein
MRRNTLLIVASLSILVLTGCSNKFWDPTQIGRFRPVPVQHVILDSLGLAEEGTADYVDAELPRPEDVIPYADDYVLHPGDRLRLNIYELLEENVPYLADVTISESGKISIPEVGVIKVAGYTEQELEEELKQILSPDILKTPIVTVTLVASDYRSYSILGTGILADTAGGRFLVPRGTDFRVLDAIATAGGCNEFNVKNIFVTRQLTEAEMENRVVNEYSSPGVSIPGLSYKSQRTKKIEEETIDFRKAEEDLLKLIAPAELPMLSFAEGDAGGNVEWVFKDGRWVPVETGNAAEPDSTQVVVEDSSAEAADNGTSEGSVRDVLPDDYTAEQDNPVRYMVRVIKIPWEALRKGDPRYNVVIKPGDVVAVPSEQIGECVVMGNVRAIGYVTMSGRPMTLMQAIAAAGGLGPLADPANVEVRRRIGDTHEEIVQVNLDKIAQGLQPDFFIKRDDTINVGTNSVNYWLYVLRNAFSANYGFSYTYSRMYYDYSGNNTVTYN